MEEGWWDASRAAVVVMKHASRSAHWVAHGAWHQQGHPDAGGPTTGGGGGGGCGGQCEGGVY
eukprot:COSAG05_NODE_17941_length_316_cov_1.271889_1_plen_61_part_01